MLELDGGEGGDSRESSPRRSIFDFRTGRRFAVAASRGGTRPRFGLWVNKRKKIFVPRVYRHRIAGNARARVSARLFVCHHCHRYRRYPRFSPNLKIENQRRP